MLQGDSVQTWLNGVEMVSILAFAPADGLALAPATGLAFAHQRYIVKKGAPANLRV